ncbi:hypothetical protein KC851_01060 [Candidatus Kaiserbacteria bacterium]|nr:hypothetical protein [Candidatus Kaiserbacteria bacterium]
MLDRSDSSVQLFSYADDQPNEVRGSLIPDLNSRKKSRRAGRGMTRNALKLTSAAMVTGLLVLLGVSGYGAVTSSGLVAAPVVTIVDPYTKTETVLEYGPQDYLSNLALFEDTRDAFIEEGVTFIDIDLNHRQLKFFYNGVLLQSAEILAVPDDESWWKTPSGLYEVTSKREIGFNNSTQTYLPWQIVFQGNLMIHGLPYNQTDKELEQSVAGAGVQLESKAAELLFKRVKAGMPVLVHDVKRPVDEFVYEPKAPTVGARQYFIADIDNGTILASSDAYGVEPIASLTKLMTAVVASEEMNLDDRVRISSPSFVSSLIPRLSERNSVSMYSLLQLLLVESSNEAAETIAGEMGRDDFIAAMNHKAEQLGLQDTVFTDPSGLDDGNVSSAEDLYRLAKYIYEDKRFIFEITANETLDSVYVGGEFGGLVNFNEIDDMDSFVGGKVGETRAAGQTSISLHKIKIKDHERVLVVILLGSASRTDDIAALLLHIQNQFGS